MIDDNAATTARTSAKSVSSDRLAFLLREGRHQDEAWWKKQLQLHEISSTLSIKASDKRKDVLPESSSFPSSTKNTNTKQRRPTYREQIASQGFSLVDARYPKVPMDLVHDLKVAIEHFETKLGIPATLVFLLDQAWELADSYSVPLLKQHCHESNQLNFDCLAWYVPPSQSGFSPHRDRQPEDVASSFHPQGDPKFVTQWMALSEAHPGNSCLYVIPKSQDPGYLEGDDNAEDQDPLQRALHKKEDYQHIRALPRKPGDSILFSHRLIHWGSKNVTVTTSSADGVPEHEIDIDSESEPRIAISFVASDPKYEAPYLKYSSSSSSLSQMPFALRLLLVCGQLICYQDRFQPSRATLQACYEICKEYSEQMGEDYRKKVMLEYIQAMEKDQHEEEKNSEAIDNDDEDEDEDVEDARMEEMLNAEHEGYGEFQDDFDELEEENDGEGMGPEESEDDDEEETVDLFGKRALEDPDSSLSKKVKLAMKGGKSTDDGGK